MPNFITIKDGNAVDTKLHTIEDSTSTHFNQSIPTDSAGNVATVVSATQLPSTAAMGALVVSQRDALPAGTNILGKVSIAGMVTIGGAVSVHGGRLAFVGDVASCSIGGGSSIIGKVSTAGIVSVWDANTIVPDTDAKALQGFQHSVNIAAGYVYNRASNTWDRMTGTSVGLAVTQAGTWGVGINAGTNLIGAVSVRQIVSVVFDGTNANIPVSIAPPTFNVPVSLAPPAYNLPVSVHPVTQSGTWNVGLNAGTNLVGAVSVRQIVSVQPDGTANWPVSIAPPTFNIPVSLAPPALNFPVSVASTGIPNSDGQGLGTASHLSTRSANMIYNSATGNWDRWDGKVSVGNTGNIGVSVAAGKVSVNGMVTVMPAANFLAALPAGGFAVGGEVSSGTATFSSGVMAPFQLDANGRLKIAGTITGGSMTQTVGAAVTTEGYPMLGSDGSLARRLLTTTGGALVVHVSNAQPTPSGISMTQTVGAAVTAEGYPMLGSDGTLARRLLTTTGGALVVHVSNTSPGGPAGSTMTQTVGAAVTTEGYPMLGTDGTNARIVRTDTTGRIEANVSLGGSTAIIGSVSISPNGLNIPVSIAAGRVSVNGMVTVVPATNFLTALPAHGFGVGGEVSTANGTFSSGVLAPLQLDTNGRLKISGTITGGSMTQTVGAAVTTEGYPMLGSDGTNARRLLTTTGGALVVHVSNTAPGGSTGGGSVTVSIGGAVSTQANQIAGVDNSGNARTIKTNVSGVQVITTRTFMNQDIFTRPNDTTAYAAGTAAAPGAAGDLIANSVTNTAVKPLKFRVAKGPGEVSYIRGARLYRTGGGLAAGQHAITGALRLHLFNTNNEVSVANGDNGALLVSPVSLWLGYIDLTPIASAPGLRTGAGTSVQVYWGAPARTGEMIVPLSANQVSIQGILECRVAFTPIANEIFTVQVDGFLG